MDISISLLKELGYKKIEEYYRDKVDLNYSTEICDCVVKNQRLSIFSFATNWSSLFEVVKLEKLDYFIKWYKSIYPMVGLVKDSTAQTRVSKAYKKLRVDYLEATGVDIKNLGIYLPYLESARKTEGIKLTSRENALAEYLNSIFAWTVYTTTLTKNSSREQFEGVLRLLTEDNKIFVEEIRGED